MEMRDTTLRIRSTSCIFIFGFCSVSALKLHFTGKVAASHTPRIDPSFNNILPIEWVHVPKTGSSFVNTLIHIPGVCPGLPDDLYISEETMGMFCMPYFTEHYDPERNCNTSAWNPARIRHEGIESSPRGGFQAGKGRFMMFMRQPEQRMISSFNYKQHTVKEKIKHTKRKMKKQRGNVLLAQRTLKHLRKVRQRSSSIEQIKEEQAGCVTKMLTRDTYACEGSPPTRAELDKAMHRLRTGFSFIGMTDQWNLSICLFNTMFNQKCRSDQFANARPTASASSSHYDTSILKGYVDRFDTQLFNVGAQLFEANLKKYKVSESSCTPCYREAGLL